MLEADCVIIIPVYNVGKHLERCLASVLNQTVCPKYVLLIDDGSTDESAAICDDYAAKNEIIHAFHKPNGGVSSARNYGLDLMEDACRASNVMFIDPDDSVDPSFVQELLKTMADADIAVCGYQKVLMNDRMVLDVETVNDGVADESKNIAQKLIKLHENTLLFMCWNKCFRREIIEKHHLRFQAVQRLEDALFVYDYLCFCQRLSFTEECLYRYSVYVSGRMTATTKFLGENCEGQFRLYETGGRLLEHLKKMEIPSEDIASLHMRFQHHLESGVFGEIANSIPASKLKLRQRKYYIIQLLNRYRDSGIATERHKDDVATRIVKAMCKYKMYTGVAVITYIFYAVKELKKRLWYAGKGTE